MKFTIEASDVVVTEKEGVKVGKFLINSEVNKEEMEIKLKMFDVLNVLLHKILNDTERMFQKYSK